MMSLSKMGKTKIRLGESSSGVKNSQLEMSIRSPSGHDSRTEEPGAQGRVQIGDRHPEVVAHL